MPEGGSLLLRLQKAEKEDKKSSCFGEKAPESRVCLPVKSKWKVKREDPNALVLEMFRFAREGGELSTQDYPISAIQDLLRKQKYEGEILLETQFTCAQAFEGLELVVEYPEKQRINLDGREIDSNAVGFYRTFGLEKLFLGQVEAGIHKIRIRRHFQLKKKATTSVTALFENLGGVELEPLILLGDFAVQSAMEPSQNGCIRFNRDFLLTKEAADSVETGGYPFY